MVTSTGSDPITSQIANNGAFNGQAISQGHWWLLITSLFIQGNLLNILFSMISLYLIGTIVERFYGTFRWLLIYFLAGIIGELVFYFFVPSAFIALGASVSIAGVFGALGAFFFVNRNQLGGIGAGMLQQWGFWLMLNVILNVIQPGSPWQAELGGLLAGIVLGIVLIPHNRRVL